jgi:EpsI family protein
MSAKSFAACLVLLLLTLCAVGAVSLRPAPLVVQTKLERLPMGIAGYSATEDSFSEEVYRVLNADMHVYRHYRSRSGDQIDLYIGYYGTAKGGRTGHNPYACLPGEGSAIVEMGTVYLENFATKGTVPINFVRSKKDGINTIMLHWYQTAGSKVLSNGLNQNMERFVGKILHNRNDGAFVRLTTLVQENEITEKKKKLESFAGIIINMLPAYWPIEK